MRAFCGNLFINGSFKKAYLSFSRKINKISFSKKDLLTGEIEDYSDYYIVPGFIDLHTNGANGVSFIDSCKSIEPFLKYTYAEGVTTSFPTFIGMPLCRLKKLIKELDFKNIEGIHLEGPFISPHKPGIHRYVKPFNYEYLKELFKILPKGLKVLFTFAPEINNSNKIITFSKKNGWVLSCGHSDIEYSDALKAINKGVKSATHFFNAMSALHHRSGGAPLAFFNTKESYIQIVSDGIHISSNMIEFIRRNKDYKKIIVVTDNLPMTGLKDGVYKWGEHLVSKKGLKATIGNTLAGSLVDTETIFKILMKSGFSLEEIIAMRSFNPSKLMGMKLVGSLEKGNYADFVILSKKLKVYKVFKRGKRVF
jgi:N-acetylglucosamine-6-phosphate deacetylase